MDVYVSLKGWVELDHTALPELLALLKRSVEAAADHGLTKQAALSISNGWHVPRGAAGRSHFVFFGAELRADHLPFVRAQVEAVARLRPADEGAGYPAGLFHLDPHDGSGAAAEVWRCRAGAFEARAPGDAPAR